MKRHWLIIILLLLTTACGGTRNPDPAPTEPLASPAASTQVDPTEMAEQPATLTASSPNVTATLVPTTPPTQTPSLITPQPTRPPTIHPNPGAIIAQVEGNMNWFMLLGGSQMESWISAGDVADVVGEGTEFQINTVDEYLGWATTKEIVHEQLCDQYYISLDSLTLTETAVGVTGDWLVTPRKPVEIPIDTEVYLYALADWLVEQSSSQPIVAIKKIWRVDLEGNGTEEVLLNATRFAEPSGHDVEPRDYSVVLLRTVIGNQVTTIELVGDFYPEAVQNQFPLTYNLEFVGDLNGDGMMEVVIGIQRWEGTGVLVFEIDQDQVNLVLSVICHL